MSSDITAQEVTSPRKLFAIPLLSTRLDPTVETKENSSTPTQEYTLLREKDKQSSDERSAFINGKVGALDVLTLTPIIRLGDQVFTKLFTDRMPLTEFLNENPECVTLFIALALAGIYCYYRLNEARELKNSPTRLAKRLEEKKLRFYGEATLAAYQQSVQYIYDHDLELKNAYHNIAVEVIPDQQGNTHICLIPTPSSKPILPEPERNTLEEKFVDKIKVVAPLGYAVWYAVNFPAVNYWIGWGFRGVLQTGGLDIGFSTGLDPYFVAFGVVIPVLMAIGLYAPKFANYVNNNYGIKSSAWKSLDKTLLKPIPNPVQNKWLRFPAYILLGLIDHIRSIVGVIPAVLMASYCKLTQEPLKKESEQKRKAQVEKDMAEVMRRVFLLDAYKNAGLKLDLEIPEVSSENSDNQSKLVTTDSTNAAALQSMYAANNPANPPGAFLAFFLLKSAQAYVWIEFTWWWMSDVHSMHYLGMNPDCDLYEKDFFNNSTMAWLLIGIAFFYGICAVIHREKDSLRIEEKRAELIKLQQLKSKITQLEQDPELMRVLAENPAYQKCPENNDPYYAKDLEITYKQPKRHYLAFYFVFMLGFGALQGGYWIGRGFNIGGTANMMFTDKPWLLHTDYFSHSKVGQNWAIFLTCTAIAFLYTTGTWYFNRKDLEIENFLDNYGGTRLNLQAQADLMEQTALLQQKKANEKPVGNTPSTELDTSSSEEGNTPKSRNSSSPSQNGRPPTPMTNLLTAVGSFPNPKMPKGAAPATNNQLNRISIETTLPFN